MDDPKSYRAIRVCDIAFNAFFQDVKLLVSEGVKKDIKHRIATAENREQREKAEAQRTVRSAALKSWLKSDRPLAYGVDGSHDTFNLLVRAIAEDDLAIYRGLNGWDANAVTPFDLVDSLVEMSSKDKPKPPRAPVLKDGAFLPVLKVTHSAILDIAASSGIADQRSFLKKMLLLALTVFHVKFVPSHLPNVGSRGRRFSLPVYDQWGHLGVRHSQPTALLLSDPDISSLSLVEPETVAYNNAVASDCTAPWTAADKDLLNIKECLNRTLLPDDFEPPSPSREEYVNLTYKFVEENYTGTKPIHHLALLVSIIVASTIIPKIFPPQKLRNLFLSADSHAKVRAIYDDMDWVERNKKGMTDKSIFISMITTFIIAIYEPKSPLMKHMLSSKTRGLGNAWTDKYCAPLSFPSLSCPFHRHPSSLTSPSFLQLSRASPSPSSFVSASFGERASAHTTKAYSVSLGGVTTTLTYSECTPPSAQSSLQTIPSPLTTLFASSSERRTLTSSANVRKA